MFRKHPKENIVHSTHSDLATALSRVSKCFNHVTVNNDIKKCENSDKIMNTVREKHSITVGSCTLKTGRVNAEARFDRKKPQWAAMVYYRCQGQCYSCVLLNAVLCT